MEDRIFDIELEHEGRVYKGWISPSKKNNMDGTPKSFHVVLDKVFFANLSFNKDKWVADEPRPDELVQAVGNCIDKSKIND